MSTTTHRPLARLGHALSSLVGLAAVCLTVAAVALLLLPPLAGFDRYVIEGGSMEPTIPRGSMVYERRVPVSELHRGDVVTFVRPGERRPVTHRIIGIDRARGSAPVLRTQGDANARPDLQPVRLRSGVQPRVRYHVPVVGWPLIALSEPRVRSLLPAGAAALAVLAVLAGLWREGGRLPSSDAAAER